MRISVKNGVVKWWYKGRLVKIDEDKVQDAFKYTPETVMILREGMKDKEFVIYGYEGVFRYRYEHNSNMLYIGEKEKKFDGTVCYVEYDEKHREYIAIISINNERKLIVLDNDGEYITEIKYPKDYLLYVLKNMDGDVWVVLRGMTEEARDKFGRSDWQYRINFENYSLEKIGITM